MPSSDCLLTQHAVPTGAQGDLCSSKGLPVAAQGTCQCFTGYDGPACELCGGGYQLLLGICQRTLDDLVANNNASTLSPQAAASPPVSHPPPPLPPATPSLQCKLHAKQACCVSSLPPPQHAGWVYQPSHRAVAAMPVLAGRLS